MWGKRVVTLARTGPTLGQPSVTRARREPPMVQNDSTLLSGSPSATLIGGIAVQTRATELSSISATLRGPQGATEPLAVVERDHASAPGDLSLEDTSVSSDAPTRVRARQ